MVKVKEKTEEQTHTLMHKTHQNDHIQRRCIGSTDGRKHLHIALVFIGQLNPGSAHCEIGLKATRDSWN